ncbi:Calx-beta domain-containing protein [Prosthecobacter fusiformis]|uniref:Calx-beta domain-containing protein n=1 Tax=Prosthecobacter fusiformis TaxID=48464 RepID=A0A4R7SNW0_9BACT|nr:choice-of-anchor D domain-containing protein [Prosthecobacter fusiformis]TDU80882.1 Calx-beta domain-containing protein [Prosthecobacter fusiformis]
MKNLLLFVSLLLSFPALATTDLTGPPGSVAFGSYVKVLPNGNIVVTDPSYGIPGGATKAGAAYLIDGATLDVISTLTGSNTDDQVGSGGIVILSDGNFVVISSSWNGNNGAVTWGNSTTGFSSNTVSASNSLVGGSANDAVGAAINASGVCALANGRYVVASSEWNNPVGPVTKVGAYTWCDAGGVTVGLVSPSNSLVGGKKDDGNQPKIAVLSNGNYVVACPGWDNPSGSILNVGAVTWCNGAGSTVGLITASNSLIGGSTSDGVGSQVMPLTNGNYVVRTVTWDNPSGAKSNAGATTWCNGLGGTVGVVSSSNSIVGTSEHDSSYMAVVPLTTGHYVIALPGWDNPTGPVADVGAVIWGNGSGGTVGEVSASNALIGGRSGDNVGTSGSFTGVTPLANGHYVVASPTWDNPSGPVTDVGAVTWCKGDGTTVGLVTSGNSLTGSTNDDRIAGGSILALTALPDGNYVVCSSLWDNPVGPAADVGAVTWCNGTTGRSGAVSAANSLIGGSSGDRVGSGFGASLLTNGNYVVSSPSWDNPAGPVANVGAVTWCKGDGTTTQGLVTAANSMIGVTADDAVGERGAVALANGNYAFGSPSWTNPATGVGWVGAATWGNGSTGTTGVVTASNSIIGATEYDNLPADGIEAFSNGGYLLYSPYYNFFEGALTYVRGDMAVSGQPSTSNTYFGRTYIHNDFDPLGERVILGTGFQNKVVIISTAVPGPEIEVSGSGNVITDGDTSPAEADNTEFGSTTVEDGTVERMFTIENTGPLELNLSGTPKVVVGGSHAGDFTVSVQPSSPVASNNSTTFEVIFDPSASGLRTATLSITNDDSNENPYNFSIQGTGTAVTPEIAVSGNSVEIANGSDAPTTADHTDFGDVATPGGSLLRTFTIANSGSAVLNLTGSPKVAVSGTHAADFSVTTQPGASIAASGSTTFQVTFAPAATGLRSATLSIQNDDSDENPYTFDIQGTGTGLSPEIAVEYPSDQDLTSGIASISFGIQAPTTTSAAKTFTIRNTGSGSLSLQTFTKGGAHPDDFIISAPVTNTVGVGLTTTFTVTYQPRDGGSRSATLSIGNNDSDENPFQITLTGSDGAPMISLIPDQSTDEDTPVGPIAFTVADEDGPASAVTLSGTSENPDLIPDENIVFGGSDGNRTITLTPAADRSGVATIFVEAADGSGNRAVVTFVLTVDPVSEPPIALDQADMGKENDLLHVALQAYDPDGDALTYTLEDEPEHGTVTINEDGTYSYLPDDNFLGADKFTYLVNDGGFDSNVTTVTLMVVRQPSHWSWMAGYSVVNQPGTYNIAGPNSIGVVGSRSGQATWSLPGSSMLWVFGGTGCGDSKNTGLLNDLWRCNLTTQTWTWLGGSKTTKTKGTYGTLGVAAADNIPGARTGGSTWIDSAGDLWLFGGTGLDSTASGNGLLNDLWKYSPSLTQWTWMGGSKTIKAPGVYGTQGSPQPANVPGARSGAATWVDTLGNLWLFGGTGYGATTKSSGTLNDLWKYNITTQEWTWMKGPSTIKAVGTYGAQGVATASTIPGSRSDASAWVDKNGMFWLFGGNGIGLTGGAGDLNDLWKYDPSANLWTWVRGETQTDSLGNYGTLGIPAATNDPAARAGASPWVDAEGALCFFGGDGRAVRDDIWRYLPDTNQWTWIKGSSSLAFIKPIYGDFGIGAPSNTPGSLRSASAAADTGGDVWVFGGGSGTSHNNSLWKLDLPPVMKVQTNAATSVTGSGATLNGIINPRELATTAWFRYSPRLDMVGAVLTSVTVMGDGTDDVPLAVPVTGLTEGTTYYYQLVGSNPFGQRSGGMRTFTTTGTAPPVTVAFESTSSTVKECDGTAVIMVALSAPAPVSFDLPFIITGTATPGSTGDYTAPASSLSFVAGQMVGRITIPIRNDLIPEVEKTLIVTLNPPSAGATLGGSTVHTITLQDGDVAVVIVTQPQSKIVAMGSTTTLSVTATGTGPLTYQWKKNGAKISGATSASYSILNTPLTAANNYTVDVTNPIGTKPSAKVDLYVVDTTPKYASLAVGSKITFTVNTGGVGLGFQWYKGVTVITPAKTKTLSLSKLTTADAAVYTCIVSKSGIDSLTSGEFRLTVPTSKPEITPITALPPGVVGGSYLHVIEFNDDPLKAPKSFSVTGLPTGLKLDATTGVISGDCTVGVTDKAITITATNSAGTSTKVNSKITILGLPPTVQGTWLGVMERRPGVGDNLGARLDLTVTSTGNYTGKLLLSGTSLAIKGNLMVDIDTSGPSPVVSSVRGRTFFTRKGLPSLDLNFVLGLTNNLLTGSLLDPAKADTALIDGIRNKWSKSGLKATDYVGYYTFGLDLTPTNIGDIDCPQGNGFGSFNVAEDGKLSVTGRTADGLAYTTAGFAGPSGQVVFFAPFKPSIGSLVGMGTITAVPAGAFANNTFTGSATWNKGVAPKTSSDQAYRPGFPSMALDLAGGKYKAPVSGGVVMGLTNYDNKARINFSDGGLNPGDITPHIFSIRNTKTKGITQSVKVIAYNTRISPNPNPYKVNFALASSPSGAFIGAFTLPNANSALVRTAKYQGIIVWDGSAYSAMGYFLLPKLPEPGQTIKTSPVLSGLTVLDETQ